MTKPLYRIVENGNGEFFAQRFQRIYGADDRDGDWIFYMDFEDIRTFDEAEEALQFAIRRSQNTIRAEYDPAGNRLPADYTKPQVFTS
jgi:hypothetical protein